MCAYRKSSLWINENRQEGCHDQYVHWRWTGYLHVLHQMLNFLISPFFTQINSYEEKRLLHWIFPGGSPFFVTPDSTVLYINVVISDSRTGTNFILRSTISSENDFFQKSPFCFQLRSCSWIHMAYIPSGCGKLYRNSWLNEKPNPPAMLGRME